MSLEKIREYFESLAPSWDDHLCADSEKINCILDACGISEGHRVVDIACGTGVLFEHILGRQPSILVGVDACEAMAKIARNKFCDDRLRVETQDFFCLEEDGFDRAVLYNSYPHFFDKAALAKKIHDVLGKRGRFVLAHGQGRHIINSVHKGRKGNSVSVALEAAVKESKWFEPFFDIDMVEDSKGLYIISGTKKTDAAKKHTLP
jgi:demethylmenaquinone methyltransferase/2-methoxy-6-polyprenyl-1,4-benzoquinol methylase